MPPNVRDDGPLCRAAQCLYLSQIASPDGLVFALERARQRPMKGMISQSERTTHSGFVTLVEKITAMRRTLVW